VLAARGGSESVFRAVETSLVAGQAMMAYCTPPSRETMRWQTVVVHLSRLKERRYGGSSLLTAGSAPSEPLTGKKAMQETGEV
jgi:hypothetical protein